MDGVDCDWCLVCEKHTSNGAAYCSSECRSADLISSSASSSASTSSSSSGSAFFGMTDPSHGHSSCLPPSSAPSFGGDSYPMPPFVRKQRTSIPNIYAHCTSNPNPPMPTSLMFTSSGGYGASALTHHLQQQQQQQQQQATTPPSLAAPTPGTAASQYPLFYATLNALRPASPSGLPSSRQ